MDFSKYITLSTSTAISVSALNQTAKSRIDTVFSNAQNLPTIILEKQYAFSIIPEKITGQSSKFNVLFPATSGNIIEISKPREGESLVDQRPTFSGFAYPN